MVALNYGEIESHPERVSNTFVYDCLFINKYNWNEINYPCKIDAWHGIIGVHSPPPPPQFRSPLDTKAPGPP